MREIHKALIPIEFLFVFVRSRTIEQILAAINLDSSILRQSLDINAKMEAGIFADFEKIKKIIRLFK